jgi:hypothetical protein
VQLTTLTKGRIERFLGFLRQGLGKTMIARTSRTPPSSLVPTCSSPPRPNSSSISVVRSPRAAWPAGSITATRGLLYLDEIGYLSYDARAADLLFQVVSRRYERKSLVLTTNLPFSDWPTIFPNAATATALIDRLVHHAEIITMVGTQMYVFGGSCRSASTR